jgi:hypothetical protein
VVSGGAAAAKAWRDRKKSPAEALATKPRPVDAALRAMLEERARQQEAK